MTDGLMLYPASALFCARESVFNILLVEELERKYGFRSYLPQRDGFEFSKLTEHLRSQLKPEQVASAVEDIIYLADMGIFVPRSQVVVANLDEPLDPGVLIEIAHARAIGKFIVGYRTDVRSPYGDLGAPLRGIHFFPAYQCHVYLFLTQNCRNENDARSIIQQLASEVHSAITSNISKRPDAAPQISQEVVRLIAVAKELFKDLNPLNSDASLVTIAKRYVDLRERISEFRPIVIGNTSYNQ